MSYLRGAPSRRATPQSQPIPGSGQVANSAGGFGWQVPPLERLKRFLVLGSEGGSYYAAQQQLTTENVTALSQADPHEALALVVEVSTDGRAPKQDPAIFALAYLTAHDDTKVRQAALDALPQVCRTASQLFTFLGFVESQRGWGRSLRRAVGKWFVDRPVEALMYQAVKYRTRNGWSHRDVLRLAHPSANPTAGNPRVDVSDEQAKLFDWLAGRTAASEIGGQVAGYARAVEASSPKVTARLIREYNLPREAVNNEHLTDAGVWDALLEKMPLTAMVRNLPTMTRVGLLKPGAAAVNVVQERLTDGGYLQKARVHPLSLLVAQLTYQSGHGIRSSAEWTPVTSIVDALDAAFYSAFEYLEPTGVRYLLALDISASMDWTVLNGVPGLTPRVAAAAMAMATAATGDPCTTVAFSSPGFFNAPTPGGRRVAGIEPVPLSPRQRIDDVCRMVQSMRAGGTDCALPAMWATVEELDVDAIVIYTDSETWAGRTMHPSQALQQYRQRRQLQTAQAVIAMESNGFSIADPNDPRQLDCVGFDTSTPGVVADFAAGKL